MNEKLVSVIMSVYNEDEKWLQKSIESIINQSYRNIEFIIVLDNPNNDIAKKVIQKYLENDSRVRVFYNEKNIGLVASLNKALGYVKGDYVARMDADDIAYENRIEKQMEVIDSENVDFIMSSIRLIDEDDDIISESIIQEMNPEQFNKFAKYGNVSTHPTWLLKKKVYDKLKGYRDVKYCEDFDFIIRAIQNGVCCMRTKDVLLDYRVRNVGISKLNVMEQAEKAFFLRKEYRRGCNISNIDVDYINQKFGKFSDEKRRKYSEADAQIEKFSKDFSNGKYMNCVVNFIRNYCINRYYRKLFNNFFVAFIVRKKFE